MDNTERKINEKFAEIEGKLRNSFQAFKSDINSIKQKLEAKPSKTSDLETKKEIESLKDKLSSKFNDINSQIESISKKSPSQDKEVKSEISSLKDKLSIRLQEINSQIEEIKNQKPVKQDNSELRALTREISSLKDRLATKDDLEQIKSSFSDEIKSLKKQVSKSGLKEEITKDLEQKQESKFSEFLEKFNLFKSDTEKTNKQTIKELEKERESIIKQSEKDKQELLEQTQNKLNEIRKETAKRDKDILSKISEKDERIDYLQKQISYLKGQIKLRQPISEQLEEVKEEKTKTPFKFATWLKVLIILIPLLLVGYIGYNNFVAAHDFNYFYDIGSEADAKKPYLTPANRMSDIYNDSGSTYRNITNSMVSFNVPSPRGRGNLSVNVRFKDNFPEDGDIKIGLRLSKEWNYSYSQIFKSKGDDRGLVIASSTFELGDTYISENEAELLIYIPHLNPNRNETLNNTIPLDWINITVHKKGLFEKDKNETNI